MKNWEISGSGLLKFADKATFWAFCACVFAVYILDMIFFGSLVPWGPLTLVFIIIGAVLRTIAVASGVFLQKFSKADRNHAHRGTLRALWVFCVFACLLSAINFFAVGHASKAADVTATANEAGAQIDTKAARIGVIDAEIAAINTALAESVASVDRAMKAIENDGVPGLSKDDNKRLSELREEEQGYRAQARDDIRAARERQEKIRDEKDAAAVKDVVAGGKAKTWEVFIWLGDHTPLTVDAWSNGGLFYFALLIEAIAAFGLGAYVALKPIYARAIALVEIDEATRAIRHEAELTSARIRAEALRRQLAKQAEAEARALDEEGSTPAADPPAADPVTDGREPPPDPPEPDPPPMDDMDPKTAAASKGGAANQHKRKGANVDDRIPVGDWREMEPA